MRSMPLALLLAAPAGAIALGGGFTTVINLGTGQPDGTSIGNNQSVGSDTQLNVFDGGAVGDFFDAGPSDGTGVNTEVNLFTGGVLGRSADFFAGSTLNLEGGSTDNSLRFRDGSALNLNAGTLGFNADFLAGSNTTITGGNVLSSVEFRTGSTAVISGGIIEGSMRFLSGSDVTMRGDDFRLNGAPIADLAGGLPADGVFTGVYENGQPFAFTDFSNNVIDPGTVTLSVQSAAPSSTPAVLDSGLFTQGVRPGESLTVTGTGETVQGMVVLDASLHVDGGTIGDETRAVRSDILLSAGVIGENFEAIDGVVRVEGGLIDAQFVGTSISFEFTGGAIEAESRVEFGSVATMTGGETLGEFQVESGSSFHVTDGVIGTRFGVEDSTFRMDGGSIGESSGFRNAVATVTAGDIAGDINIDDTLFRRSGGSLGPVLDVNRDSTFEIYGSGFTIGGGLVPGLTLGVPMTVTDRDTILRGTFADGTPFEIDLDDREVDDNAVLTITPVADGCRVAHIELPRTEIDFFDLAGLLDGVSAGSPRADYNGDGSVDGFDTDDALQDVASGCSLPF